MGTAMAIRLKRDRWVVEVYDPLTKLKRHVGSYKSRQSALKAEVREKARKPIRCCECGKRFYAKRANHIRCRPDCVRRGEAKDQWLYRCFDAKGHLLYVGISSRGISRMGDHSKDKPWWAVVSTVRIEHFGTRAEVEAAERKAVKDERPQHNTVHTGQTPRPVVVDLDDYRQEA